jgi:hypothetical protein
MIEEAADDEHGDAAHTTNLWSRGSNEGKGAAEYLERKHFPGRDWNLETRSVLLSL